jgi:hypothetical protein
LPLRQAGGENIFPVRHQLIFLIKVVQRKDGGIGKTGENMGVCKEYFFIHPPVPEKSNYLSAFVIVKSSTQFRKLAVVGSNT